MKAIQFDQHGTPDVLQLKDVPQPSLGPHDVEIKLHASGLNHLDIWVRQGLPGITIPLPHTLGCDGAGEVTRVGSAVKKIQPGLRAVVSPGMSCLRCEYCASGWDSLCPEYRMLGFQVDGTYAEYVKAPEANIIPVSDQWSFEEWAAAPLVFLTAWHMLMTRAGLKTGETVLIQAAGSGVGSAAIQIAKLSGARVITTCGQDWKVEKAQALGADLVIQYQKEDVAKQVSEFTDGRGADVVFEHIGPDTWQQSLASLAKGGRLVTCGATSGPEVKIDLRFLFMRQQNILGSYMGGKKELLDVIKLLDAGKLQPIVDKTFPLKDARKAHEHMLGRNHFGKIVLKTC